MAYIGVSPSNGIRRVFTYTATANQTSFSGVGAENITLSYKDANYVDVYQNGVKLASGDYTATSGTAIVLGTGATVNDMVVIVVFDVFSAADTVSKADGGQFDGNVTFAGTATFSGSVVGISSAADDITPGDAAVNLTTTSGNITIDAQGNDTDIIFKGTDNSSDITMLTLDGSDAGTATFNHDILLGDNSKIKLGASGDLEIYHDGSNSHIDDTGTGVLVLRGNSKVELQKYTGEVMLTANADGAVDLYHNDSKKFETTSSGVTVTGSVVSDTGFSVGNTAVTGQEIDVSSGDFTLDVAGDIILDAGGGDVNFQDDGTVYGFMAKSSNSLLIGNSISDGDVLIRGNDGGSNITAVTFDMSANGDATFNGQVIVPQYLTHEGDGHTYLQFTPDLIDLYAGGVQGITVGTGQIIFNQGGADVDFRVETAGVANFFQIDAGNDQVRINSDDTTSNTKLRIEGNLKVSNGGQPTTGNHSQFVDNLANSYNTMFHNRSSSPANQYIVEIGFKESTPDNNGAIFIDMRDQTSRRCQIFSSGDVQNHDNSYSGFSDVKLKEQISDSSEQWDDIKALKIRKFKFKTDVATGDSDAHWRLGVIAQEVEEAGMNGLVTTNKDTEEIDGINSETGTTTKAVKYSILYMKAVKALQEAMTRIETLETKVKTLEG